MESSLRARTRVPLASSQEAKQDARIEFRCSQEDKSIVEEAANAIGITTASFIKSIVLERAKKVLKETQITVLSERDANRFYDLLESDLEPNDALKKAAQKYKMFHEN